MKLVRIILLFFIIRASSAQDEADLKMTPTTTTRNVREILRSPKLTNWGEWNDWKFCRKGHYVDGMNLTITDSGTLEDDTALNSILFSCRGIDTMEGQSQPVGQKSFRTTVFLICIETTLATGFSLRSQPLQTDNGDNLGATDFKLICGGENKYGMGSKEWNKQVNGFWTGFQHCPPMTAICGLQTQIQHKITQGPGDKTSLNNINVACCEIENLVETCKVTATDWVVIKNCSQEGCKQDLKFQPQIRYTKEGQGGMKGFYDYFGLELKPSDILSSVGNNKNLNVTIDGRNIGEELMKLNGVGDDGIKIENLRDCKTMIDVLQFECWIYTIHTGAFRCRL